MNQYLLLLGPTVGFILGVFFVWFLSYARMRQVERQAAEEKMQLENKLEEARKAEMEVGKLKTRLDENQSAVALLQKQSDERARLLGQEKELRLTLEERVKKIEILEKVVAELKHFEQEAVSLREKCQSQEISLKEKKEGLLELQNEIERLKDELKAAVEKQQGLNDSLKDLAVLKERTRKFEEENCNLLKENEQLRNIEAQLRQIAEIKEMYSRTVEENQTFRNQDIARQFLEIKHGLQQSIKAYNRMLNLVNNPLLEDDRLIEIENETREESEEELLEKVENDTEELKKVDGA